MTESRYDVTYVFTDLVRAQIPRRVGPLSEDQAEALARELARRAGITCVEIERWTSVEKRAVTT